MKEAWGYLAFNRVSDSKRTKLDPKAMMSVFVGYTGNTKKYTLLIQTLIIVELKKFYNDSSKLVSDLTNSKKWPDSEKKLYNSGTMTELARSQRVKKERSLNLYFVSYHAIVFLSERNRDNYLNKIPILLNIEEDSKTFIEVMIFEDAAFWK